VRSGLAARPVAGYGLRVMCCRLQFRAVCSGKRMSGAYFSLPAGGYQPDGDHGAVTGPKAFDSAPFPIAFVAYTSNV